MRAFYLCPIALLAAVLAGTTAAPADDAAKGLAAARACVPCHGAEGISRFPDVPHLAGQNWDYLIAALSALRRSGLGTELSGVVARRSDSVMVHHAAGLADADIETLASYYSSLACAMPAKAGGESPPPVVTRCLSCHGDGGRSVTATVPRLAGQRQLYLENQMKAFRDAGAGTAGPDRERHHPMMKRQVKKFDDGEIVQLARYFAAQPCK